MEGWPVYGGLACAWRAGALPGDKIGKAFDSAMVFECGPTFLIGNDPFDWKVQLYYPTKLIDEKTS